MMLGDMSKSLQTVVEYNTDKFNLNFKKLNEKITKDQEQRMVQSEIFTVRVKTT